MAVYLLRKATLDDMSLYFEWANDLLVRQNAFNVEPIPYTAHEQWFARKLSSETTEMYVMEDNGVPVGQIRFDMEHSKATIDYSVAPHARGRGLGVVLLQEGIRALTMTHSEIESIHGAVKMANVASRRAFERAGFTLSSLQTEDGVCHYEFRIH
jgi:RimJ/RimL family protein N-acetyltransferase